MTYLKKSLTIISILIFNLTFAQKYKFEDAALDYLIKHLNDFRPKEDSTNIYFDYECYNTLSLDFFLSGISKILKDGNFIKSKSYGSLDSLKNSQREDLYKIKRKKERVLIIKRANQNHFANLSIYRRFYYDGLVYVYTVVRWKEIGLGIFLKYDLKGNLIDTCRYDWVS